MTVSVANGPSFTTTVAATNGAASFVGLTPESRLPGYYAKLFTIALPKRISGDRCEAAEGKGIQIPHFPKLENRLS